MPSKRRGADRDAGGASHRDRWLLSYADYMTLLLALFVVLYASARIEITQSPQVADTVVEGLRSAFVDAAAAPDPSLGPAHQPAATFAKTTALEPISPLDRLEGELTDLLDAERRKRSQSLGISLRRSERGLVLSLASAEFFPEGGVAITPERRQLLAGLAPILASSRADLRFEGHSDDLPIESEVFPSNWELSSARAAAVARIFIDDHELDPHRVATTGYAEFRPLTENRDAADRARNRRVEIVILEDLEPGDAGASGDEALDRLLDALPPIPDEADESLRAEDPGPPPADIPLP